MTRDDSRLLDLARRLLSGEAIDWEKEGIAESEVREGMKRLQRLLEKQGDATETSDEPPIDMEYALRQYGVPLYSLESKHALAEFDIIGFPLPYETLYTNALNALDLGGVPLFSTERGKDDPLVIAGGHATYNPEPMHAFIDAFVIGEGEDVIQEIIDVQRSWKAAGSPRQDLLRSLAKIWAVYVPSLYRCAF